VLVLVTVIEGRGRGKGDKDVGAGGGGGGGGGNGAAASIIMLVEEPYYVYPRTICGDCTTMREALAATEHTTVELGLVDTVQKACTDISNKFGDDKANAVGYPLMEKTAKDKAFGKKMDSFVEALVEACEAEVLHDDFLMKTVSSWTTAFSTPAVRAFRHTCTPLVLKLGECFIRVHNTCEKELKSAQRQLETESKKSKGKKAPQGKKAEALGQRINEVEESIENLWELIEGIYSGESTHRYRDVSYVIRQLACESLGKFVCLVPSKMMEDKYLKYIGWLLNDKDASVRRSAVDALRKILMLPEAAETLDLFVNRFKARVVNMCEDKHPGVVASALELSCLFATMDKLEAEETENMQELVFSEDAQIRKAAGKLLNATLVETDLVAMVAEEALDNLEEAEGVTASPALILRYLANVCNTSAPLCTGKRARYLVDAVWPHTDAIKDDDDDDEDDDESDDGAGSGLEGGAIPYQGGVVLDLMRRKKFKMYKSVGGMASTRGSGLSTLMQRQHQQPRNQK